jgi:MFS family permease
MSEHQDETGNSAEQEHRSGQAANDDAEPTSHEISNNTLIYTSVICFLAWVFSVYDYTLFGTLLPVMADEFGWSTAFSTAVITYVTIGTAVVSLSVGPMLDYIGRKKSLMVTTLGAGLSSALTAFTPFASAVYVTVARLFGGLGFSEEVVNTTYLNEMYGNRKGRGLMYSFVQGGWPVGVLIGAASSALLLPIVGWRGTFLVATLPAILVVILALKLRESPVYEAIKRVRELEKEDRHEEADELRNQYGLSVERSGESTLRQIFQPNIRTHTIFLSLAWLFNWFGIQIFSILGTTVLTDGKGVSFGSSLIFLVVSNAAGYVGYITHGFVGDRFGRRRTIGIGWAISGIAFSIMLLGPDASAFVLTMYTIGIFFLVGPYAALLFYMGESFPARMRGTGAAFAHAMGPIGAVLGSGALSLLITAGLSVAIASFIAGAIATALSGLCMFGAREVSEPQQAEAVGA